MASNSKISFIALCKRDRYLFLLISLLSLILILPLFEGIVDLATLHDIFITGIFLASLYAISRKGQSLRIAVGLLMPIVGGIWLTYFVHIPYLRLVGDCCSILFFAFTIIIILSSLFREDEVTLDVIYSSVAVFLLMALMWTFIFDVIEYLHPGSFLVTASPSQGSRIHFIYYSFVTITTLGYGDITPTSDIARSLALLEAVIGQIYLVVLVARLVGIHIAQSMAERRS